ncbi:MAG TPA: transglycosylase domain-containing protein, partial [Actinomycetota bacterium]|nr:transglycosylase domain-containing protein [Actinomycetota bacterium]
MSRVNPRHSSSRGGDVLGDTALRAVLRVSGIALASALCALALLPAVAAAGRAIDEFTRDFTRIGSDVDLSFPRIPERSTIYAADGSVLATLYLDENREYVRLPKINRVARKAVLAIEDARFYEHEGLDLMGVARALAANVTAGEIEQGASTITQQLARNVFPRSVGTERTLTRKIEEARVAMRLEQEYSKEQILELYLNEVYFGRGIYGIGTAAEYYFGTTAKRLSLRQAATLAGLIAAPETYSPINDRDAAIARRNVVLSRMRELGMIAERRAERAMARPLGLDITDVGNRRARFPYFVEYIKRQILHDPRLGDTFGETYRQRRRALFQGGLQIFTTLDPDLEDAGERIVRRHLPDPNDPEA